MIERKHSDGTIQHLVGGFFNTVLDKFKQNWLPCEGEAIGNKLFLNHFSPYIRESDHVTVHYTDSFPCVLTYKGLKKGAFSSSARISAFLTEFSTLPIELHHKPCKEMHSTDFASRHPISC